MQTEATIPDVSVIIVNWNTRELLGRAIASVEPSVCDGRVELIVVDNASTDGSVQMARERRPRVRLIENAENVGYTRACNQGLSVANGRYLLFLNPDAELTGGCLETLLEVMERHPEIGACSPQLREDRSDVPAGVFPRLSLRLLPVGLNWRIENRMIAAFRRETEVYDVEWLIGACLMVRREALEQVGPMEERLFMWYDDTDLGLRLKRAGWRRVVVTGAVCRHEHGASASQVPGLQADLRKTMAEYTYWRIHSGRLATAVLYLTRLVRLSVKAALLWATDTVTLGKLARLRSARAMAVPRALWHLRHGWRIVFGRPRAYSGEEHSG